MDNNNANDCGCEGNCCEPKKKSPLKAVLFVVIILAAFGIVAFKLTNRTNTEAQKKESCTPGASSACDTTKNAGCDTSKNSSCCGK